MNYFLKILGSTHMPENVEVLSFFVHSESLFWEKRSIVLFSDRAAAQVREGDILIQYIPKGLKNNNFAGRVVGCFRIVSPVSRKHYATDFGQWDNRCEVESLFPKFSAHSKNGTVIYVDKLNVKLGGQLQSGIQKLSQSDGARICKLIADIEDKLC